VNDKYNGVVFRQTIVKFCHFSGKQMEQEIIMLREVRKVCFLSYAKSWWEKEDMKVKGGLLGIWKEKRG
jgi:hypothetical protein